jgi:small nuclear ribonucleoprotein (snRNP)-like protein
MTSQNYRKYRNQPVYDPTKCTIVATCHLISINDLDATPIPIGWPLPGYPCLILDERTVEPVCVGTVGKLFIGGTDFLAGYLNRLALAWNVLVTVNSSKYYCIGDLVRIDEHGNIVLRLAKSRMSSYVSQTLSWIAYDAADESRDEVSRKSIVELICRAIWYLLHGYIRRHVIVHDRFQKKEKAGHSSFVFSQ